MGRPRKRGLEYFPVDADIFDDFAIRILISRYGSDGFTLFMYILTKVYKDNGYYLLVDEDLEYIISSDLKMSPEKVKQVLAYLFRRSLLVKVESTLPVPVTVITSAGIQRRFQEAVKVRGQKNAVEVKQEYWILEEKETLPFIKVQPSSRNSGKKESFSEKNPSNSQKNATKKRKVNKSKEKKSISAPPSPYLSDEEANRMFECYLIMRRETESISDVQIETLIGKLIEITEDPAEQKRVIEEAIIHRWKSFFPLKKEPAKAAESGRDIKKRGSFYNFEERQRSQEEYKELEHALLGVPPAAKGTG